MEERGVEWVCPNCSKKKAEEIKGKHISTLTSKRKSTEALFQTLDGRSSGVPNKKTIVMDGPSANKVAQGSGITQCVVCKKEARNSSIYCSDACILAHAQETCTKDKPVSTPSPKVPKQEFLKGKLDARIMVFDRKTGKVLSGMLSINFYLKILFIKRYWSILRKICFLKFISTFIFFKFENSNLSKSAHVNFYFTRLFLLKLRYGSSDGRKSQKLAERTSIF